MVSAANAIRKATQEQGRFPMPLEGLNYQVSLLTAPPTAALLLDNMVPVSDGLEIRGGWRDWIPEASRFANEVRTIIPFTAQVAANSRLFCSTADAVGLVYNVSTLNAAPVLSLTPSTASATPGEWYYTNFNTPGGSFLCMVSKGAGYYYYSAAGGWVEPTLTFPVGDTTTAKDFTFCWTWKNRLWFLKHNSAVAYYLPISSISGALQSFDLSIQLVHGGSLTFALNWTYDSGRGIDDGLIFASTEGDVIVYQGTDPASITTFSLQGTWYVGRFPMGRRCFVSLGGDVLLLTEYGITKMSDLVSGRLQGAALGNTEDPYYKLNPKLGGFVAKYLDSKYWFLTSYPTDSLMIIGAPYVDANTGQSLSFLLSVIPKAWATISQMDLLSGDLYYGKYMFGTRDGNVCQGFYGFKDGVSSDGLDLGAEITARIQTPFNDLGYNTLNKRLLRMKLYGLTDGMLAATVKWVPEYDLLTQLSTIGAPSADSSLWDVAVWDAAKWAAAQFPVRRWIGIAGFGKKLSLLMAVRGQGYVLLSDYEILYETGYNL